MVSFLPKRAVPQVVPSPNWTASLTPYRNRMNRLFLTRQCAQRTLRNIWEQSDFGPPQGRVRATQQFLEAAGDLICNEWPKEFPIDTLLSAVEDWFFIAQRAGFLARDILFTKAIIKPKSLLFERAGGWIDAAIIEQFFRTGNFYRFFSNVCVVWSKEEVASICTFAASMLEENISEKYPSQLQKGIEEWFLLCHTLSVTLEKEVVAKVRGLEKECNQV